MLEAQCEPSTAVLVPFSMHEDKLWSEYAVCYDMRSVELHNVWQYVFKPGEAFAAADVPCFSMRVHTSVWPMYH